jgi:hypothetical protein
MGTVSTLPKFASPDDYMDAEWSEPPVPKKLTIKEMVAPLLMLERPATPEAIKAATQAVVANFTKADRMDVELAKEDARTALKGLGCSAKLATDLVKAAVATVKSSRSGLAGQDPVALEPPPWPEPVDGAKLLTAIRGVFERYTVLAPHASEALALNALRTHVMEAFEFNPLLVVISPVERCGKTHVLGINASLVARPWLASRVTSAAVPRIIDGDHPSLILDEVDTYKSLHDDFKGTINSCHHRPSASVTIQTQLPSGEWAPRMFSTYTPVFLGFIGSDTLPRTQWDRSVVVYMKRKKVDEVREDFDDKARADLLPLKRQAIRWAIDNRDALGAIKPKLPEGLNDRQQDSWRPLLAIAERASGLWPKWAREAAVALTDEQPDETPVNVYLLGRLRDIFGEDPQLPSSNILARLNQDDEAPWKRANNGTGLDAHELAKHLRDFQVRPRSLYWHTSNWPAESWGPYPVGGIAKGYPRVKLEDAWARYLASPVGPPTPSPDTGA